MHSCFVHAAISFLLVCLVHFSSKHSPHIPYKNLSNWNVDKVFSYFLSDGENSCHSVIRHCVFVQVSFAFVAQKYFIDLALWMLLLSLFVELLFHMANQLWSNEVTSLFLFVFFSNPWYLLVSLYIVLFWPTTFWLPFFEFSSRFFVVEDMK